jgi:hypothetical protein
MIKAIIVLMCCVLIIGCNSTNRPNTYSDNTRPITNNISTNIISTNIIGETMITNYIQTKQQLLVYKNNNWKMVADTAWLLTDKIGNSTDEMNKYILSRKNQGFNTIITSPNGSWFDKSVSKPNMVLINNFDKFLKIIEKENMFIVLSIQMHQYKNGIPISIIPQSEAILFGQFWGERYANNPSIAFYMIGGLDDKGVVPNTVIMNQALGVRQKDKNHLITFHPRANYTTLDAFPISDVHQIALYQSYHTYDYVTLEQKMNQIKKSGVPFTNIEMAFDEEGNIGETEITKLTTATAKWNVFGYAYGNHYVWQFDPQWKNHLNTKGVQSFLRLIK